MSSLVKVVDVVSHSMSREDDLGPVLVYDPIGWAVLPFYVVIVIINQALT